jgi:hypothetical protein
VYLFYPETAGRTLEDVDRFFDQNKNILVFTDPAAKSNKRPTEYDDNEREEMHRNSSISPQMARRRTSVWQDSAVAKGRSRSMVDNGDMEKGSVDYRHST